MDLPENKTKQKRGLDYGREFPSTLSLELTLVFIPEFRRHFSHLLQT